ncbi:MAG: hypothetical protein FJ096_11075 [Deltaproteobacteria bacterium]|nr:hypothetical protein [Deltaproteobacteria bacterium]
MTLGILLAAGPSFAEPPAPRGDCPSAAPSSPPPDEAGARQTCLDAFKRAQRLRRRGELLSARAELLACGQPLCPDAVETKCVAWVEEVRGAIPTIVVRALDDRGRDLTDVAVAIDGEPMATSLDGLALELDPGPHEVRVTRGGRSASQRIVALQGAKNRGIELRIAAPAPIPPSAPPRPRLPVLSWVGFGLGAGGLVVGTVTGVSSLLAAKQLDCPNDICFQYQEEALRTGRALAHTSTASFALAGGGVLLGIAGLTWLRPSDDGKPAAIEVRPSATADGLGLEGRF